MNIWANDVANNVWPAVWSKTISLKWAIVIAAIWEASWAMIAWWEVVNTIKNELLILIDLNENHYYLYLQWQLHYSLLLYG
jgi:PiT family inorganic phosphate transporter